jgi:cytochrome P450
MTAVQRSLADFTFPSDEITKCPFPFYERMRDEEPVYKHPERNEYLISRRADIMDVLSRPQVFSNATYRGDSRMISDSRWADPATWPDMPGEIVTPFSMSTSDEPEHGLKARAARGLIARERLAACEDVLVRTAHELIDSFIGKGEVELRTQFADPLAMFTICELAGFPKEDRPIFLGWHRMATGHGRRYLSAEELAKNDEDKPDQQEYCERIIMDRYENPTGDFLSQFIKEQVERDGEMNLPYLVSEVNLILVAGNETTSRMLSSTMLLLLQHPDQLAKVLADRSLVPNTIEESLRFESPTQWISRYCLEDTIVGGVDIPAGAFVTMMYGSANRDDTWGDDADEFNIERPRVAKWQMAFGGGIHRCLGAPIARLEGRLALDILLDRLKNPRLAPGHEDDLENIDNIQKRVPRALHIQFDSEI